MFDLNQLLPHACVEGIERFERGEQTLDDWYYAASKLRLTGYLHCIDGVAYYRDDRHHRDDGPAAETADGTRVWYRDGQRHRDDGPAVEYANGTRVWYRDGLRHRDDGPAVERADGSREWYRDGVFIKMEKANV